MMPLLLAAANQQGSTPALPTTNLVAHFISDTGVTSSAGRVSAWADQSGAGNDAVQASGTLQPYLVTSGFNGRQAIQFQNNLANIVMSFAAGKTWNARSLSFFIAGRLYAAGNSPMVAIANYTNSQAVLRIASTGKQATSVDSTLRGRMNPAVYGNVSGATSAVYQNNGTQTGIGAIPADTDCLGGFIGASTTGNGALSMEVWEIACYDATLSGAVADEVIDYFNAKYGLTTSTYSKAIMYEGDSITAGLGLTTLGGWPFQLVEYAQPLAITHEMANVATSGATIATLTSRATTVDGRKVSGATNYLHVLIGRNDADSSSAATIYSNLATYVSARVAAGWNVVVGTCLACPPTPHAILVTYNDLIRGTPFGGTGPGIIADAGATAVIDYAALPEFDAPADRLNSTYYQGDGTHLTAAGGRLIAELAADYFLTT